MAEYKRIVGSVLNLNISLTNGDDTKFVRVFLKDFNGIDYSQVDLVNAGNGIYFNNTEIMPNTPQVKAVFVIYDDAGYTLLSPEWTQGFDTFDIDNLDPASLVPNPCVITAEIGTSETKIEAIVTDC